MDNLILITKHLIKISAPVTQYLRNGISALEFSSTLQKAGLNNPTYLMLIYSKIDGAFNESATIGSQYFFPNFMFPSFSKAIELYQEECIEFESWQEGLIPLFWNGNLDYLLADYEAQEKGVYYFSNPEFTGQDIVKIFDSVESLFATINECYETGAYYLDNLSKTLKSDQNKERDIALKLNPESEYWKLSLR